MRLSQSEIRFNKERDTMDVDEVAYILIKLRHYTKKWESEYGGPPKLNKKQWEARADEWIQRNIKNDLNIY
jgi:hypothetical protein